MIEILLILILILILSVALNAFLLHKYIPIWIMFRKEAQTDKKIEAEITAMGEGKKVEELFDLSDLKNLLPSSEELDDLLDGNTANGQFS